jgi:Predicted membrane protein (DUF2232)
MPSRGTVIAAGAMASAVLAIGGALGGAFGLLAAYFAGLPLYVVGFAAGRQACLGAVAIAAVAVGVALGPEDALMFLGAQALPALLVIWASLRIGTSDSTAAWAPPGTVLALLASYGVVAFAILALSLLGEGGAQGMEAALASELRQVVATVAPGADATRVEAVTAAIARYFPAIVLASWTVMTAANAVIGLQIAGRIFGRQRPEPTWSALTLPSWLMTATAAASLLALVGKGTTAGFIGGNAALALCVPYAFLGFAVAHTLAARLKARRLVLWGLYLVVVLLGWPVLAITALGFVEDWIGVRRRVAGKAPDPEDRT